ncbi:MAG: sugar phosphate nucleotidyltransferase [bacterium]|nr:sugar phosphate nucleotidyltransferase [bacterium]
MKAIIPVAGVGTRLRPHTYTQPKVLLNVAGKPIIAHILDQVEGTRIDHIVFIVGYLKEVFQSWAKERYSHLKLEFIEQTEIMGLGHAVGLGLDSRDSEVMIILGDTIFDVNLESILNSSYSSLGIQEVEDARRFGVVVKKDDFISDMVEKSPNPPSHQAIVGLYYIKNGGLLKACIDGIIQDNVTTKGEYQITDALRRMIQKGEKMTTFEVKGWYDCGTSETLLDSNRHLLARQPGGDAIQEKFNKNNILRPPIYIAPSARVVNSIIGPSVTIGEDAEIDSSVIKDSIIADNAKVHSALLNRSIIGREASVTGAFNKLNVSDHSEVTFT